jgi:hypothetical protein
LDEKLNERGKSMDSDQNQYSEVAHPKTPIHNEDEVSSPSKAEKSTFHADATVRWQKNRSEIAAFLQQWDLQMEAMQQGLHGVAMTARHDFTMKRMSGLIDEEKVEAMWQTMRQQQNASPTD